ncbi:MAG: hypothetical protein V8Q84_04520 [Bilophila sp.]
MERLGLNAGTNAFGRGNRANACISRALHLIINNVGGSRPGITDMSTLGLPLRHVRCGERRSQPAHGLLFIPNTVSRPTATS